MRPCLSLLKEAGDDDDDGARMVGQRDVYEQRGTKAAGGRLRELRKARVYTKVSQQSRTKTLILKLQQPSQNARS
ncbi:unnamed protein product [Lota lota]